MDPSSQSRSRTSLPAEVQRSHQGSGHHRSSDPRPSYAEQHHHACCIPPPCHCRWPGGPAGFDAPDPRPSASWPSPPSPVQLRPQYESEEEDKPAPVASDMGSETASDSSPDEDVGLSAGSPDEDLKMSADQMARMALALELDISLSTSHTPGKLLRRLYNDTLSSGTFPIVKGLDDVILKTWERPADLPATSKKVESMYKIKQDTWPSLFKHPPPSSLVTEEGQRHRSRVHSAPPDKEGRKLDAYGRRQYSVSALNLRIGNYQTIMGGYQLFLWEKLSDYIADLPEDKKTMVRLMQREAVHLSKQQMNAGRHAVEMSARGMGGAILMRRHSWLRSTALPPETKFKVERMPFEGTSLFASGTDKVLSQKKKNPQTAESLGIVPVEQYTFKPKYFRRHQYQYYHYDRPYRQFQQPQGQSQRPFHRSQQSRRRGPYQPKQTQSTSH